MFARLFFWILSRICWLSLSNFNAPLMKFQSWDIHPHLFAACQQTQNRQFVDMRAMKLCTSLWHHRASPFYYLEIMTQKIWQDRLIYRWAPIVGLSLCFLNLQRKQKLLLQMGSSNNSRGFRAQNGQSYWKYLFQLPLREQRWCTGTNKKKAKIRINDNNTNSPIRACYLS